MTFALVLAGTIAACFILRNPIRKYPVLFYVLAVAVDVAFFAIQFFSVPHEVWKASYILLKKCLLPLALFVVVMYIGVFPRTSKVSTWLRPIRAELSIIACILTVGHMAAYMGAYLPRMFSGGHLNTNVFASFLTAIVVMVLLIVLGITSFTIIKKRMHHESWIKLQKLAYLFFILVYVHLLFMLLPAAMHGGIAAQQSVIVYTVVFGLYIVARIARSVLDKDEHTGPQPAS